MTITELEECIDLYGKEIYGFCRQVTGSREEGDDLYQDTFLRAVELKEKIDVSKNPQSYLLSVAVRLWKNKRRKYAWRQRIAGMESFSEEIHYCIAAENEREPESDILAEEERIYVHKCVQALEEKYRVPVCLYYSAELSVREIAKVLRLPEGTVKSRLHKARKTIKEKLEVAGYDR